MKFRRIENYREGVGVLGGNGNDELTSELSVLKYCWMNSLLLGPEF